MAKATLTLIRQIRIRRAPCRAVSSVRRNESTIAKKRRVHGQRLEQPDDEAADLAELLRGERAHDGGGAEVHADEGAEADAEEHLEGERDGRTAVRWRGASTARGSGTEG